MLRSVPTPQDRAVFKSLMFVARLVVAWFLVLLFVALVLADSPPFRHHDVAGTVVLLIFIALLMVITGAVSHLRRVRLVAGRIDEDTLGNRQRRRVEIPFDADESFDLLDAAIRELPRSEEVESARDSLQVRAKVQRPVTYGHRSFGRLDPGTWFGHLRNQIFATVTPGDGSSSVTLICEPEAGAWSDWFRVDDGTNLENAEAITRAITRRVAEKRRHEKARAAQSESEKERTVARLNLLHAQVEPHFLYNTLASAQYLTRTDPAQADHMLGHLIHYLRHSLPLTEDALSTVGDELERTRAYLEIMKLRMGPRLSLEIDVADALRPITLPPMMLQTLVENAIKHGLERKPGGGTVWIRARRDDGTVAITVADDGLGFTGASGGTGIGLKNVRERLRLIYGPEASLSVVSNAPEGVASTIVVPVRVAKDNAETSP
ncbi:MAG TPA: histidine kinase [Dyella sp.]|uniref:sensor histidine kinase n=1 Tax=Dyella sp. TaxID=1869338 RepID=UPI002D782D6D|nr:histidine kinase [Dyella sp.]HET6554480.1 histidine kinase [Dyella sp.]